MVACLRAELVHETKKLLEPFLRAELQAALDSAAGEEARAVAEKAIAKHETAAASAEAWSLFNTDETDSFHMLLALWQTQSMWRKLFVQECQGEQDKAVSAATKGANGVAALVTFTKLLETLQPAQSITNHVSGMRRHRLNQLISSEDRRKKEKIRAEEQERAAEAQRLEQEKAAAATANAADTEMSDAESQHAASDTHKQAAADADEAMGEKEQLGGSADVPDVTVAGPGEPSTASTSIPPVKKKQRNVVSQQEKKELSADAISRAEEMANVARSSNPFVICDLLIDDCSELVVRARELAEKLGVPSAPSDAADRRSYNVIFFDPPKELADSKNRWERSWLADKLNSTAQKLVRLLQPSGVFMCICNTDQYARLYVYLKDECSLQLCTVEPATLEVYSHSKQLPKGNQKGVSQIECTSVTHHHMARIVGRSSRSQFSSFSRLCAAGSRCSWLTDCSPARPLLTAPRLPAD